MTEDSNDTVRGVAWSEILPWLNLFRVFRLAIGFRVLLLAAAGLWLMFSGWALLGWLFYRAPAASEADGPARSALARAGLASAWDMANLLVPDRPALLGWPAVARLGNEVRPQSPRPVSGEGPRLQAAEPLPDIPASPQPAAWRIALRLVNPIWFGWRQLTWPVLAAFRPELSAGGLAFLMLCGLWALAVWAFFGGGITRIVSVQLACEERLSWGAVLHHATSKWLPYFAAPVFPLIGIALTAIPIALLGLLLRIGPGMFLLGLIWPLLLLGGLLMAMLLLGLLFGWPLMWATISTEGSDSFDALSRSYAYTFQRPLQYLFYLLVAAVLGLLGWLLVSEFTAGVVGLVYWSARWGAGIGPIQSITEGGQQATLLGNWGAACIRFWVGLAKTFALGFLLSYFWTATTAIYYLLRQSVDATAPDDVYLDEEEPAQELPPLKTEGPGAPEVVENSPPPEAAGPPPTTP